MVFNAGSRLKPGVWYLSGPMSGKPSFNYPMFDRVAAWLRSTGYNVISPAELDTPEMREIAMGSPDGKPLPGLPSWGWYVSRDVKCVADECTGIIFLPGWPVSRGARLEALTGIMCQRQFKQILPFDGPPYTLTYLNEADVRLALMAAL